jgi:serine/threonine protein phosphatase PrpC
MDSRNLTFAVADGVGGYSGAKQASAFAIEYLCKNSKSISDRNLLAECIQEIHKEILKISKKLRFPNMGTTLASSIYGIIQYLGVDLPIEIHTSEVQLKQGSALLLCSDGITDNLLTNRGASSKLVSLIKSESAEKIVNAAMEEGLKPDDMTAVLVYL